MKSISELKIQIFADGADKRTMLEMLKNPIIRGFTTNPSLMRKAGIADYAAFACDVLTEIRELPISFEVFAGRIPRKWSGRPHTIRPGRQRLCQSPGDEYQGRVPASRIRSRRLSQRGIKLTSRPCWRSTRFGTCAEPSERMCRHTFRCLRDGAGRHGTGPGAVDVSRGSSM